MEALNFSEIANAVSGVFHKDVKFSAVFTDSRKPIKDALFIALQGENFDGHDFIPNVENTAAAIMLSKDVKTSLPTILVEDTTKAYLDLASYYRSLFDIPLIALTGSVGKTTTKEMLACVLSRSFYTLKTEGNHNNEIGVSKTLLELNRSHEAAVIEMGMNHQGEISRLSKAARPNIAIITNIGMSHIENLKSKENILKAKLEILDGMNENGKIVLNADDELLYKADTKNINAVYFGIKNKNADVYAKNIEENSGQISFIANVFNKEQSFSIPAIGLHNVYNALAAICVGSLLGVDIKEQAEALKGYVTTGMRQRIKAFEDMQIIEDCYNSSPDSVKAAINVLKSLEAKRKIAVLGDMLELGEYSKTAHRLTGELAAKAGLDYVFGYGEMSKETAKEAVLNGVPNVYSFTDADVLAKMLSETAEKGDAILFKASRGMKLENVMEKFYSLALNAKKISEKCEKD